MLIQGLAETRSYGNRIRTLAARHVRMRRGSRRVTAVDAGGVQTERGGALCSLINPAAMKRWANRNFAWHILGAVTEQSPSRMETFMAEKTSVPN